MVEGGSTRAGDANDGEAALVIVRGGCAPGGRARSGAAVPHGHACSGTRGGTRPGRPGPTLSSTNPPPSPSLAPTRHPCPAGAQPRAVRAARVPTAAPLWRPARVRGPAAASAATLLPALVCSRGAVPLLPLLAGILPFDLTSRTRRTRQTAPHLRSRSAFPTPVIHRLFLRPACSSRLSNVLENGNGSPGSLAVLYLELAERLSLPLRPVALEGGR